MPTIFRTGRHTNFKVGTQTEHEHSHQRQVQWPPRSKVKVARSHDTCDRCWPISRERNVLETPTLIERFDTPQAMHSSFKAKDGVWRPVLQTSAVTRPVTVETKTVSYLLNGKTYDATNFRIGTPVEHALSAVTPIVGSCTWAGAYCIGRTRWPHSLFFYWIPI